LKLEVNSLKNRDNRRGAIGMAEILRRTKEAVEKTDQDFSQNVKSGNRSG